MNYVLTKVEELRMTIKTIAMEYYREDFTLPQPNQTPANIITSNEIAFLSLKDLCVDFHKPGHSA